MMHERHQLCFSKILTGTQMRWSAVEREANGVIQVLMKFDMRVFGMETQIIADKNPVTCLIRSVPHGTKLTYL